MASSSPTQRDDYDPSGDFTPAPRADFNPNADFSSPESENDLAHVVDAVMDVEIGRGRRSVLTARQAVLIARAKAFGELYGVQDEVDAVVDWLLDTAVSVKGLGNRQLVEILASRVQQQDLDSDVAKKIGRSLG